MYRPAFAPSADLPASEDENDEDLDRVIQHDLPTTRAVKPRTSLKQKLGSLVARVGSVRKGTSPPPPLPSASTSTAASGEGVPAAQGATVRRGVTVGGGATSSSSPGRLARPEFNRKGSSNVSQNTIKEEKEGPFADNSENALRPIPTLRFDSDNDENIMRDSEGGIYAGGFVGLARKLSRRATTGGASSRGRSLRDERENVVNTIQDREAAEAMLRGAYRSSFICFVAWVSEMLILVILRRPREYPTA
jgi:hypothetical protein